MALLGALLLGAAIALLSCGPPEPEEAGPREASLEGGGSPKGGAGAAVEVGSLGPGDDTLESGEWVDAYPLEGIAGQRLDILLTSEDLDTYLLLVDPEEGVVENDDDEDGNSSLHLRLGSSGTHQILVTSYEPGERGDYRLEIRLGEVEPLPEVTPLELGDRVEGLLEASDRLLLDGEPVDVYAFEAAAGTPVRLTMESDVLDTYLELVFPDGVSLSNDDDWEHQERSRIELTLPQSGRYEVWASSYWGDESGAYRLSLDRSRSATAPLRGAPARTFALLAGISDYGGKATDLERTADDARTLQRVLVERAGMAEGDSILLVDSAATRSRFRASLEELASRMTPADQLVLFFSGHGSRVRRGGYQPADPDAVDETLLLRDGDLTDDELAELLAAVPGRVLLALDSCFSGGFAKDVISAPGRMGIFSSEEDVTSSVADKFEAGGYLSAFLAQALASEWADDGDGFLTTLELSHFLHESYRAGVKGGGPDDFVDAGGPTLSYQRLVVDRGSLAPTDILFTLGGDRD